MKIFLFGGGVLMQRLMDSLAFKPDVSIVGLHPRMMEDIDIIEHAHFYDIPVYDSQSINELDFLNIVVNLNVDLIVSCNEKQIFQKRLIDAPKIAALNLHCGYLPLQRGGGGMYSAFINQQNVGITVHYISDVIDAGDVIVQAHRPIQDHENIKDIQKWVNHTAPDLYIQAIQKVIDGTTDHVIQQGQYTYTPAMPEYDNVIDWREPSKLIRNRVRARQSPVWCFTFLNKKRLYIRSVELVKDVANYIGPVGQVIARMENGIVVKTGDNALLITSVAYDDHQPFVPQFKISTTFGINLIKEYFDMASRIESLEKILKNY
jgi:methionyl-tRNA formyltransferase